MSKCGSKRGTISILNWPARLGEERRGNALAGDGWWWFNKKKLCLKFTRRRRWSLLKENESNQSISGLAYRSVISHRDWPLSNGSTSFNFRAPPPSIFLLIFLLSLGHVFNEGDLIGKKYLNGHKIQLNSSVCTDYTYKLVSANTTELKPRYLRYTPV